eukprot:3215854-Rhodomonas_salina.1
MAAEQQQHPGRSILVHSHDLAMDSIETIAQPRLQEGSMEAVNDRRQKPCRRKEREGVVWSLLQRETVVVGKDAVLKRGRMPRCRMKHWTLERQSSNHFHQGDNAIFTIGFESTGSYLVGVCSS